MLIAPTGKEQQAISQVVNDMIAAGESNRFITVTLLRVLLDGMTLSTWPNSP